MLKSRSLRYAGLWLVLFVAFTALFTVILLALRGDSSESVAAPPTPTPTIPESVNGLWARSMAQEDTRGFHFLFFGNGEFRVGADLDTLYDDPQSVGAYTYTDGLLTFEEPLCATPGQYRVELYGAAPDDRLHLFDPVDDCESRRGMFGNTIWQSVTSQDG